MMRALILSLIALYSLAANPAWAQSGAPGWIKIASATIDATAAGTKTLDLPDITFRRLRFSADKAVSIATVKTSSGGTFQAAGGPFPTSPTLPSPAFYTTKDPGGLKQIEVSWNPQPSAGSVRIEVWASSGAQVADFEAGPGSGSGSGPSGPSGGSGSDGATSRPHKAPATRSMSQPAPPPAPSAQPPKPSSNRSTTVEKPAESARPAPPVPPVVASAEGKTDACVAGNACTVVDVFFGTDRVQVPGPGRISFGGDRSSDLTLGHSFVTVPKTNRARGTISRPWQETYLGMTVQGDPAVHFTIPKGGVRLYASEAEFVDAAKAHIKNAGDFKDHAFIYVHGFAVSFENAVYRAAQISYDLSTDGRPFGTAFVFTWPSKGSVLPTAYAYDQDSADGAADHLRQFINIVAEKTGVSNVHIIAHSMGNRVLMSTLEKISLSGAKARINQIILAAPDVDKQQFEKVARGVGVLAKGVTLYASQSDNALVLSRRLRGGGSPRAGEVFNPPGPAIVAGIDTVDISALSTSIFDFGHDKYADSSELLADIAKIFVKGQHPPSKRDERFKLLMQGTLEYWRFAN